jgi:hypothetical protein
VSAGVLASLAFALLLSCLAHTDDGCAVEVHCFACYWALTGTAVAASSTVSPIALVSAGAAPAQVDVIPIGPPTTASASRGPPAR